jgi:endo-1,4-beta-mannosidase
MIFRLGINYWPVSSAMYWWRHFDATEVAQDFGGGKDVVFAEFGAPTMPHL